MNDLTLVMQRIDAGYKIRFFEDFYGRQWIEIKRSWLWGRKKRLYFANDQIAEIKSALVLRRRSRAGIQSGITPQMAQ